MSVNIDRLERSGDGMPDRVEFDPENITYQHVHVNAKTTGSGGSNDQVNIKAERTEPGGQELVRGAVAYLVAVDVHGFSINIANQANNDGPSQLNASWELTTDDEPIFATREGRATKTVDPFDTGTGTGASYDIETKDEIGGHVISAGRLDVTSGYKDGSVGAGGGGNFTRYDGEFVYCPDRFGNAIPFDAERDELNTFFLFNEDALGNAYSVRLMFSCFWHIIEDDVERPEYVPR